MGRELLILCAATAVGVGVGAGAACKREREPASSASPAPGPASQPSSAAPGAPPLPRPLAASSFYRIDAGPRTPCTAGAPCEARLVLTALGAYHVNQKYPFKLLVDPAPGLTVDGTGTFALDDERTGTLTIRFRAERSGPARLTGTFKLSVCTEEECEIEEPKIELELPVG
jgi:hypothetical protein